MFNLRHAQARNVIERIFGVLKRRYRILQIAPEFSIDLQSRIPCALSAVHNFIRENDEDLLLEMEDEDQDMVRGGYQDPDEEASINEAIGEDEASALRDEIAEQMWTEYIAILEEHRSADEEIEEEEDDI